MACPTCDHTVQRCAGIENELNIYHCPRCGTLKVEDSNDTETRVYVPKLVERTRVLWDRLDIDMRDLAWTLGVAESIWKRQEQPKGKKSLVEMGAAGRAAGEIAAEKAAAAYAKEEELREADPAEHRRQFLAYQVLEYAKRWEEGPTKKDWLHVITSMMSYAVQLAEKTRLPKHGETAEVEMATAIQKERIEELEKMLGGDGIRIRLWSNGRLANDYLPQDQRFTFVTDGLTKTIAEMIIERLIYHIGRITGDTEWKTPPESSGFYQLERSQVPV